ncbi:hypothetical protein BDV18DRAFT_158284 [Aspergillus unguis]
MNPREDLSRIDDSLADRPWTALKGNTHWGFVVYRCTYKDNNPQWQRMLNALNIGITEGLEIYERPDLLSSHRLTVMDDAAKYDGATAHDVRDYFHAWVTGELPTVLKDPIIWDDAVLGTNEEGAVQMQLGARYNFCLLVDDVCLESLDRMERPVVKLLCRFQGYREPGDRGYGVHPEFEDGEMEFDEEDVGWMYMSVGEYCSHYKDLVDANNWYLTYVRPPGMMFMNDYVLPGTGEPELTRL